MITRWIEYGAWPLAALGVALAAARVVRALRPRRPGLCPGQAVTRWRVLDPLWWIMARGCWYDLSGQVPDSQGRVRCPECGKDQIPTARRRRAYRWHTGRLSLGALVLALCCWNARWIRHGGWVPYTPTPVLLGMNSFASSLSIQSVHDELNDRLSSGAMSHWSRRVLYAQLVGELGSDRVMHNAMQCAHLLQDHFPESADALEQGLWSPDYQCRHISAHLLRNPGRHRPQKTDPANVPVVWSSPPSDRLLEICVEALGNDISHGFSYTGISNALDSLAFLGLHAGRAAPLLGPVINDRDPQRSLLACVIVVEAGISALIDRAGQTLVDHLRDNDVEGDAVVAAATLLKMGPPAIAYLEPVLDSTPGVPVDPQLLATAELLVRKLRGDPMRPDEEKRLTVITNRWLDQLDIFEVQYVEARAPGRQNPSGQRIGLEQLGVQGP